MILIKITTDYAVSNKFVQRYHINKERTMPRLLSNKTTFGNSTSEVNYVKRILFEFGLDNEKDNEIDRIITLVKVDMKQDEMNAEFEKKLKTPVKGPMDKYVVKVKTEPK